MLSLTDVCISYGSIEIVHQMTMRADAGQIVALIGANGAGKSTTVKGISGFATISAGAVALDGRRIDGWARDRIVKCGVAHVPEGRRIFAGLTVRENLMVGGRTVRGRRVLRQRMNELTELFPILRERFDQDGATLSGGQQQMLALARALMSHPRVLLLDEPSMGIAPLVVKEIGTYIRRLKEDGVTILLVEQNATLALSLADYAYVLETGTITAQGTTDELSKDSRVREAYLGV